MNKPLAFRLRPTTFDEVIGQKKLVGKDGVIRKLIESGNITSLILYGNPGVGKTTIASIITSYYPLISYKFDASTDNKAALKDIIKTSNGYGSIILIIDEIHRMNKDIQDYLLPYLESRQVVIIGLTTLNPYISVNPAIRSRCSIFRLEDLNEDDIYNCLKKAQNALETKNLKIEEDVLKYLASSCNKELRTALNNLEFIDMISKENEVIDVEKAKSIISKPNLNLDKNGDNYYNLLSALQKSIRGSDVHASIYYLARLLVLEDLDIIFRRLTVIAYEDIGLANPSMGEKVVACREACLYLGMPEARIPLANVVIEMALSPKSNSAILAIDKAIEDVNASNNEDVPAHLINIPTYTLRNSYIYPHDYKDALVYQQYLPDNLVGRKYYEPKHTSKYEDQLSKYYDYLEKYFEEAKKQNNK